MNGKKQIGTGFVGNVTSIVQWNKHIGLAGVDHLHIGEVLFDQFSESKADLQHNIFLFVLFI